MLIKVKKSSPTLVFINVIKALLIREAKTKLGKSHLGILWILLEPLATAIFMGILLSPLLGRTSGEIPYAFFLLSGFIIMKCLTGPMGSSLKAIESNQGLLIFRQVEPIDPFIARFIFELMINSVAFTLFCVIGAWVGIPLSASHLFEVAYCFLVMSLIGFGLGLFLGVHVLQYKEIEKIFSYVTRPLVFMSCVFYPLSTIPIQYQPYLLYNPIVHGAEYVRQSLFPSLYEVPQVNLVYPSLFALGALTLGFITYRNNYHFLKQR